MMRGLPIANLAYSDGIRNMEAVKIAGGCCQASDAVEFKNLLQHVLRLFHA